MRARSAGARCGNGRLAGVAVPLWGAVVEPKGERGLSLGQIEVLTRPIDPDLVRSHFLAAPLAGTVAQADNPLFLDTLSAVLWHRGERSEAQAVLAEARRRFPDDETLRRRAADLLGGAR